MIFLKGIKEVFSKPYYVMVALSGMLLFYLLNVILSDFSELRQIADNYSSFSALKVTLIYFVGYLSTIGIYSASFILVISVLFGSYLSMAIYKTSQINSAKSGSILGTIGIFLGFIAPGCFACGVGFASVLGLSGFLLALPFKGIEVFVISLLLLLYANWSIAKKVSLNACPIKKRAILKISKPLLNNKFSHLNEK